MQMTQLDSELQSAHVPETAAQQDGEIEPQTSTEHLPTSRAASTSNPPHNADSATLANPTGVPAGNSVSSEGQVMHTLLQSQADALLSAVLAELAVVHGTCTDIFPIPIMLFTQLLLFNSQIEWMRLARTLDCRQPVAWQER